MTLKSVENSTNNNFSLKKAQKVRKDNIQKTIHVFFVSSGHNSLGPTAMAMAMAMVRDQPDSRSSHQQPHRTPCGATCSQQPWHNQMIMMIMMINIIIIITTI